MENDSNLDAPELDDVLADALQVYKGKAWARAADIDRLDSADPEDEKLHAVQLGGLAVSIEGIN